MGGLAASEDQAPALSNRLEEAMHPTHGIGLSIFQKRLAFIKNRATIDTYCPASFLHSDNSITVRAVKMAN